MAVAHRGAVSSNFAIVRVESGAMETKISGQGSSTGLRRGGESTVGKQRLGVGMAGMWCITWCVFTATTALGHSGSVISVRRGRWEGTGQHNSIAISARGCRKDQAATGRRGPRSRVRGWVRVTGEVRVRVWGRVNNTRVDRVRGRVRV